MEPGGLVAVYWECMRNHAADLGGYAVDGCCAYAPDRARPESYFCEACGCHRNFHRVTIVEWQVGDHVEGEGSSLTTSSPAAAMVQGPPADQGNANGRRLRRSQRLRGRGRASRSGRN